MKKILMFATMTLCMAWGVRLNAEEWPYLVIDLSGGKDAAVYPVSACATVPQGGFSDEYKTTKLVLRRIPEGSFVMGSPANETGRYEDETQHRVTISQPFYMCVFPVTQRQYELVTGMRPSYFSNPSCYGTRPVEQVSWDDIRGTSSVYNWPMTNGLSASSFISKLQRKTGIASFDLPTEAKWEYACRAGTSSAFNSGKELANISQDSSMGGVGRYYWNSGLDDDVYVPESATDAGTAKVGSYLPNKWGLYDMHGNVWEWCLDWFGDYETGTSDSPVGPVSGEFRVLRGGSWCADAQFCRSAYRGNYTSSERENFIGFRLCCSKPTITVRYLYAIHEWPQYGNLPSAYKGGTFNGYAVDGNGLITGTFSLAVKKPAKGKNTAAATLTFTSLATGKKSKVNGNVNLATGEGSGGLAGLKVGANAVGGSVANVGALEGGADAAKAKDAAALAVLSKFSGKSYVVALGPENPDGYAQGGYSTLAITMAAKGKAKVSGVLADGTKVSASGVMTVGESYCCVPVVYAKKSRLGFVAWFDRNTRELVEVTALTPWKNTVKPAFTMAWGITGFGAKGNVAAGTRTVGLDGVKLLRLAPGAIAQTPFNIPLKVSGTKWDAGKAAKVTYRGGAVTVNGENVSGLKLTYTAKTGLFKGAFTVYVLKGGKLTKSKFSVFGAVTGGVGYGTAVLKGKGSVTVMIE